MRKFLFLCLLGLSYSFVATAQKIQWASEVINFSSQYQDDYYSAKQALGVPNALTNKELHYMAWIPKVEDSNFGEHIQVGFASPMRIQQVAVAESLNPGAIIRIKGIDKDGKSHVLYENKKPKGGFDRARIFRHKFPLTEVYIEQLRIELHTSAVPGSNQIDAIAISDSEEDIRPKVSLLRYKEEVLPPENLGAAINSPFPERLPIISPDGQTLFFTRKQHPKNVGEDNKDDIWVAYRKKDDTWSQAVNIGAPLNDEDHNFVVATNPSGSTLFLGNDYKSRKEGVSIARKNGRSWSKPEAIEIEDHYNDSKFVGYHMNGDGDVLLMAVERKEGMGDRDFYVSFKKRNGWSKPKSLGSTINTVGSENGIFLAADNRTIYFSSNGHPGYGGFDMFVSKRLDNSWTKWSKPKNLGKKINSNQNDFNYTIPASGEYAYFSSGSMENSDLFRIKLPKEVQPDPVALITANIVDTDGKPIDGKLKVQKIGKKYKKTRNNTEAKHQLVFRYGDNIGIHAEKDGYFSTSENIELAEQKLKELDGTAPPPETKSSGNSSSEIDNLQLELKEIKKELAGIEEERQAPSVRKKTKKPNSKEDPELDALKNKFNDLSDNKSEKTKPSAPQSSGDPELDALRRKYNQHFEKDSKSTYKPKTQKTSNTETPSDEDSELAEMKRRFNQHHNADEKESEERDVVATKVKKEESPTKPSIDFDVYKEEIREELIAELTPSIKEDLHDKLFEEVKNDLDASLRKKLEPEIEKKVRTQLQKNLKKEIRAEHSSTIKDEIREEIEEELRAKMQKQIETELRKELRKEVEEELEREMEYAAKRKQEEDIRKELQQQLKDQAKAEKTQATAATPAIEPEEDLGSEPNYKEVEKEIVLVPIKVGQVIPMNNIFFDANEASLKDASTNELERVLDFLKQNSTLVVEVSGHTNGWCSHEFAHELSTNRSKVVMDYFIKNGIPQKRIQNRGYGKTSPIATNDTKNGRRKNQRVELKILEIL